MKVTISRLKLYVLTGAAWGLLAGLSWLRDNPLELLNIVGFATLCLVPGLISVLALRIGKQLPFWYRVGLIIGFSLLEILVWLLLCNTFAPFLGVPRPLDLRPLVLELSALYVGIAVVCWRSLQGFTYRLTWRQLFKSELDVLMTAAPFGFVALAIAGANSLNNNGTDLFTLCMLLAMAGYAGLLLLWNRRLHDTTISWALYLMSLSLLLMTSLRGWYVTGHDIQHEFEVFQITKAHGWWNIGNLRDAYNACLSITILPTVLANLLKVADPYVYKVFFQTLFAVVPVLIYNLMRRYLTPAKAFMAVLYFVAFPTFFTDMPFLNRQELAFLFLALMLLVVLDTRITLLKRQWLFIVFGAGVVLSHYSTTYSLLGILIMAVASLPLFKLVAARLSHYGVFKRSSIEILNGVRRKGKPAITIAIVSMLVYLAFIWNTVLTNTSNAATSVIAQTISTIANGFSTDERSSDVAYSLLAPGNQSAQQALQAYNRLVVAPLQANAATGTFYTNNPAGVPRAVQLTNAPLTAAGRFIAKLGINVGTFNYALKQSAAKLLQVFVVIGLVYAILRKRLNNTIEAEYLMLTLSSLLFVLLQVALPDLSAAYGLLRAFQQSLMLLGLFLVVGTFALTSAFKNVWLRYGVPAGLAICFFLASTGVISQLLGGYQPQLQLNNSGQYYDVYYTHPQELSAAAWLNSLAARAKRPGALELQADSFAFGKIASYTAVRPDNDIYPGLLEQNSYVYLGYTNVTKHQSAVFYNGDLITYNYPVQLLDQTKNLIYSNGGAEIYR